MAERHVTAGETPALPEGLRGAVFLQNGGYAEQAFRL